MTSLMKRSTGHVKDYVTARIVGWRTGTREGQITAFFVLAVFLVLIFWASYSSYNRMPMPAFLLPPIVGSLFLRWVPLAWLSLLTVILMVISIEHAGMTQPRFSAVFAISAGIVVLLYSASLQRSGLPGLLGEAMLVDLRDRLQSQGVIPALPSGWRAQSAMRSAGGAKFAGDFLVADLSEDRKYLEMVLVDVCGKGVSAGTKSLQFAGALGGLIGALPPRGLFSAANAFLLRQSWQDGFATAVHVLINLDSGEYSIINAGHPPALRWESAESVWEIDGARGMALGIDRRPHFHLTRGRLQSGDALMFYTDGVVESHSQDFTTGIEWLRETAKTIVDTGFDQAPRRILKRVADGTDDRAILILHHE